MEMRRQFEEFNFFLQPQKQKRERVNFELYNTNKWNKKAINAPPRLIQTGGRNNALKVLLSMAY